MNYESLRLTRNILLRVFVIGIGLTLILGVVTVSCWNFGTDLGAQWFHVDASLFGPIFIKFFVNVRFVLLYFVLAPALALHWTIKKEWPKKK